MQRQHHRQNCDSETTVAQKQAVQQVVAQAVQASMDRRDNGGETGH